MMHFKDAKILHVDDNEINRYAVAKMLKQVGFKVLSAADAKMTFEVLLKERPNLVLLDVNLPDMSGYEVCRRIKAMPEFSMTPVLHMSASFVKTDDQVRGLQGGADGYITEPVDPVVLVAKINAALRIRQAEMDRGVAQRNAEEAQARLKLLSDVGHLLAESLSPESAVEKIVAGLVPQIADAAVIVLFDESGKAQSVSSAHVDSECADRLNQALGLHPPTLRPGSGVLEGQPAKLISPVTDEWLMSQSRDGEHFKLLRGVGAREAVVAGICARGNRLGVIALAHTAPTRAFTKPDVQFIETLAQRMAVVIDNTRLLRQAQLHNRMKDEFLVSLAHELRNPLAPIRNAAKIMGSRMSDPAALEHLRGIIEKQVHHISRIIDDLTDVARIEHGKVTLRRTHVDMAALVTQAAESCNDLIKGKHQTLHVESPSRPAIVDGDPTRLVQVISNLIHNAAKYTPELGTVTVSTDVRDGDCLVRVRDNGIGISARLLPHIFDLFTQAPQSIDRPQGGLGIGLTIVRHFVKLHGGSISARSEGEGKGSEFIVRLPLLHADAPAVQAPEQPAQPDAVTTKKRVLMIDDNNDIRDTMQALLEMWGHEIKIGSHAAEALELLKNWKPNIMLLDIGLPEVNGFELAKKIRANPEWNDIRLIAVTGYSGERERRTAIESGFDQVMIKPVDIDALEIVLNS